MPTIPRPCVVDTNVLISALLQPSGLTAQVVSTVRSRSGAMLFSDQTFGELTTRLMHPKFDRYADPTLRRQFLAEIAGVGEWVVIAGSLKACRDRDDDKFLETAIVGEAECIITGDGDLLALDPFRGVRILTPRAFLQEVEDSIGVPP